MNFSLHRCLSIVLNIGLAVLVFPGMGSGALEIVEQNEGGLISVSVKGTPLGEVMRTISLQTGYSIAIDERWKDIAVIGDFTHVTSVAFFNRVLRGKNLSIIFDDEKKLMTVHLFGEKETFYYQVLSGDMGGGELSKVHGTQNEEFVALKNDPLFEDMSGISNAERWKIHRQQNEEFLRLNRDPSVLVDKSGQTNAQRWQQHQRQDQEFLERKSNPVAVDVAGVSNQEKYLTHEKQNATWGNVNNDPDAVEPLSGKSNSEIREVHRRQSELYSKEKKSWQGL